MDEVVTRQCVDRANIGGDAVMAKLVLVVHARAIIR